MSEASTSEILTQTKAKVTEKGKKVTSWLNDYKWPLVGAAILIIGIIIMVMVTPKQTYLDYMPSAVEPCPSHYRCGATTKEQVAMENRLYADLRESEKYTLPATLTADQISVVATDSEPTGCMMARAAVAKEGPKPEGLDNTWESVDNGFEFGGRRAGQKVKPLSVM